MTDSTVPQLTTRFNQLSQRLPDDGIEFWFARDLMEPLGYARWENFTTAIQRAIESCQSTGYNADDHFRGVTKMVRLGSLRKFYKERKLMFSFLGIRRRK